MNLIRDLILSTALSIKGPAVLKFYIKFLKVIR